MNLNKTIDANFIYGTYEYSAQGRMCAQNATHACLPFKHCQLKYLSTKLNRMHLQNDILTIQFSSFGLFIEKLRVPVVSTATN